MGCLDAPGPVGFQGREEGTDLSATAAFHTGTEKFLSSVLCTISGMPGVATPKLAGSPTTAVWARPRTSWLRLVASWP